MNNWFTFLAMAVSCAALWIGVANRREDQRLAALETLGRIEKKRITSRKFFKQAQRRAHTIIDYPTLESPDSFKDLATEWLEVVADIETNHDEVVEQVALVSDSLHRRRHFDLGKLKVLESSLDGLLELTASFLELVEVPVGRVLMPS
ncbi:hypothetical protein EYC98_08370 [Halieaceae bacterium IMCC14734]|uniref:DUF2489 domain-containing protein n=1 Tax=Candidatus Litorirhabdus singularis TaxID=2518993 RepID=A0ABT3TEZ2_9GAMM|nr:hypothetical protein [Candidatus Litorirhabdus singularis]MCX2980878.1 hypothetical protein [Candidatus Litorirhabdus singularis]